MSLVNNDQLHKARAKSVTGGTKYGIKCPHCQQAYRADNASELIFLIFVHIFTIHGAQVFNVYLESHHTVIEIPDGEILGADLG